MAFRHAGPVVTLLESIIARPPLATLVVGGSILLLQALIRWLGGHWPVLGHLQYLVPFLPPFVITRTASRVNRRRAEHDFIRDAEPLVFVAHPQEATLRGLLESRPDMISDSAARHLGRPCEELLGQEALAAEQLADPRDRERIAARLLDSFRRNGHTGTLSDRHVVLRPHGGEPVRYAMNSILTTRRGRLKWQGTLMRFHDWREEENPEGTTPTPGG